MSQFNSSGYVVNLPNIEEILRKWFQRKYIAGEENVSFWRNWKNFLKRNIFFIDLYLFQITHYSNKIQKLIIF